MLWEHIKQAHTTGSSPKIAQQYGKSTFDLITIPLGMVKAGKLGKINKIMDLLDPISNTMKIAGKTVKVTFNTTRRTFKYVINTAGKNFKRYELRFKIDGNTLYCGIPNGKISIIDKLKQADIEKLPVDENGIRIADIDGEAIPIGNKNALEKIEGNGAPNATNITKNKQLSSLLEQLNNKEVEKLVKSWSEPLQETLENDLLSKSMGGELIQLLKTEDDFLKWKLIKEDPAYAFELSKENSSWTKWGKSNFFKTNTQLGRQFESLVSSKIRNIPPFSTLYKDYTHLKQVYLKGVKDNIIADDLFVKELRDERGRSYFRAIISDSKLKATSPWTANQKSELIDVFKNNPNKKYIEFEVRSADKYLGDLIKNKNFRDNKKIRIYREDVYKIISEGDNIKIPPIKMNDINFK